MPSSAISAQGSVFSVGTGSGGAKTITAIALGNPTILTATAHGFSNGDRVTLAGLTGTDAGLLNGQTVTVRNKTTNTFALDIDTTGKTITAAGNATPVSYSPVGNVKSYSGFDIAVSELDVTNMSSTNKEMMPGLQDPGSVSIEFDQDENDAGQTAMRGKLGVSGVAFKLTLPNGKVGSFTGFIKKIDSKGGVDETAKGSYEITMQSLVVWA